MFGNAVFEAIEVKGHLRLNFEAATSKFCNQFGKFGCQPGIIVANTIHRNTVSLTTLDIGRMLWLPKQNLGYIWRLIHLSCASFYVSFCYWVLNLHLTKCIRTKLKKYLKSHKCIHLAQWATLVSFWALCEKFTQFWIALIFGTLSSSSCRPAWAFFAAYRVRQIFDVPNSKLFFLFFQVQFNIRWKVWNHCYQKKIKEKNQLLFLFWT